MFTHDMNLHDVLIWEKEVANLSRDGAHNVDWLSDRVLSQLNPWAERYVEPGSPSLIDSATLGLLPCHSDGVTLHATHRTSRIKYLLASARPLPAW